MIGIGIAICLFSGITYLLLCTPYPFVWLVRLNKKASAEKGPATIHAIKASINIEKNLKYSSSYARATYDCYCPKETVQHVLVWVHGGAFITGSSDGVRDFGPMMAAQGVMVCAINYAYAPEYAFPSQIIQLDEFLTYLHEIILEKHQLKLNKVLLGGDSAGANIVASYSTMCLQPSLLKEMKIHLNHVLPIQGLLLYCGLYDFCVDMTQEKFQKFKTYVNYIGWSYFGKKNWASRNEKRYASPLYQLTNNFPPVYLCDGENASFAWQGKRFVEALHKYQIFVRSKFFNDMPHSFQFDYVKNKEQARCVFDESLAFIHELDELAKHP